MPPPLHLSQFGRADAQSFFTKAVAQRDGPFNDIGASTYKG